MANSATFVKTDTTPFGWWKGRYGGDGWDVPNFGTSYPSWATVVNGGSPYTQTASTTDFRATQKPANSLDRANSFYYSSTNFTYEVTVTDGGTHQIALFFYDFDGGRSIQIDINDGDTGSNLYTTTLAAGSYAEPNPSIYYVWNISGHVKFVITKIAGPNGGINAIYFGPAGALPPASGSGSLYKVDTTTKGTWIGAFGADGYTIPQITPSLPAYVTLTEVGGNSYAWSASTTDVRAQQKPATPSDRVASLWYASSSQYADVAFTDAKTHRMTMYVWDQDASRGDTIELRDYANGTVYDSQNMPKPIAPSQIIWVVRGHLTVRVGLNNTGGANQTAVNGFLFDTIPANALWYDSFTDADGTALPSHVPDVGTAYTAAQGSITITAGTAHGAAGGHNIVTCPTSKADVTVAINFYFPAAGQSMQFGLIGRYTDNTHYIWGYCDTNSQAVYIYQDGLNGTQKASAPFTFAAATPYHVELVLSGSTVTLKINGTALATATVTQNQTVTTHGFSQYSNSGAGPLDCFQVVPPSVKVLPAGLFQGAASQGF